MLVQVCLGLKHMHSKGVIHRDLKPSNILISGKGLIKLADFGVSKIVSSGSLAKSFVGSPGYLPPEMIASDF